MPGRPERSVLPLMIENGDNIIADVAVSALPC